MAETAGLANAVCLDLVRSPCDLPSFAHLRTKNELADLTSISMGPLEALRRPGSRVAGPASPYARPSDGSRQALPESSRDVASAISGAHRSDAPTGRCSPRAPTQYDRIAWNQLRCSAHRARRFRLLFRQRTICIRTECSGSGTHALGILQRSESYFDGYCACAPVRKSAESAFANWSFEIGAKYNRAQ
jgi:hypothetical protein